MRARTFLGEPLTPGVSLDVLDIPAGLARAAAFGYGDERAQMVTLYALQRHARGEEEGAERMWCSYHSNDFTTWRIILAGAMAAAQVEA